MRDRSYSGLLFLCFEAFSSRLVSRVNIFGILSHVASHCEIATLSPELGAVIFISIGAESIVVLLRLCWEVITIVSGEVVSRKYLRAGALFTRASL
jgi:hypothetical protein